MGSNFSFDSKGFDSLVGDMMRDVVNDEQKWMDDFARRYRGEPVDRIVPALKREWESRGGSISTAEAREYAQNISDGDRIVFEL